MHMHIDIDTCTHTQQNLHHILYSHLFPLNNICMTLLEENSNYWSLKWMKFVFPLCFPCLKYAQSIVLYSRFKSLTNTELFLSSCTSCTIYSLYEILLTNTWTTVTTIAVGKARSYTTFAEICSLCSRPAAVCRSVAGDSLTHTWQEREDDKKENKIVKCQSCDCHIYV